MYSERSSVAASSSDGGSGAEGTANHFATLYVWPALDCAREIIAGAAVDGAVPVVSASDEVWDATTFTKNRERCIDGEVARLFFEEVSRAANAVRRLSGMALA